MSFLLKSQVELDRQPGDTALRPPHIVLVAPLLVRSATGPSYYVADVVPRLCDAGYQVTVLASDCAYGGRATDAFVDIDPRAHLEIFRVTGRFNRRIYRSTAMADWLRSNASRLDVVDIQGLWYWMITDIARVCIEAGLPYVITPHGMMGRWDWAKRPFAKRVYFHGRLAKCWRSAAAVRFLSAGELNNSMIASTAPVALIPTAVELPGAADLPAIAQLKSRLKIPPASQVVLFLGRVTHQKGVLELVQAFDLVARQCPEAVLLIAGQLEGAYGSALRDRAASLNRRDHIHILGPVSAKDKADLFASASVFVTLSRNEGMSSSILEALGNGVPAVLTRGSHFPEVADSDAGIIVELDPVQAAAAIIELLLNREKQATMSANARRLVTERFTWAFILPQLTALYDQLAKGEKSCCRRAATIMQSGAPS